MSNQRISVVLLCTLLCLSPLAEAATYSKQDADTIRRILRKAGVNSIQESLLIRRMAARRVPVDRAIIWSKKLHDMKQRNLPIEIAVDRLQQGLIKNIKIGYIDKALNVLLNNLAWSNQLTIDKALESPEESQNLDEDEQSLLNEITQNLEVAARQGYSRNNISIIMSRKGVDLEMAAELTRSLTVWTNYGVDNRRVLLSIKRISRLGLPADKVKDIRESVDSKLVADKLDRPVDIARTIWHEIRHEAEIQDAEHAYRSGMQHNPNSLHGGSGSHDSSGDMDMPDVESPDDASAGGSDGGGADGGMDGGAGSGEDMGGAGGTDGGSSEGSSMDGGTMDGGTMDGGGMGGDGMDGESGGM